MPGIRTERQIRMCLAMQKQKLEMLQKAYADQKDPTSRDLTVASIKTCAARVTVLKWVLGEVNHV